MAGTILSHTYTSTVTLTDAGHDDRGERRDRCEQRHRGLWIVRVVDCGELRPGRRVRHERWRRPPEFFF